MSEEVQERLDRCEYPFRWGLDALKSSKLSVLDAMKGKDEEVTTPIKRFYLSVVIAYELGGSEKWAESRKELDQTLLRMDSNDRILTTYREGFLHVLGATAAHVALKEGQTERAKELIAGVKDIDNLSKEDQSAVWALKANIFLEYGIEGSEKALEWADKAVECEPAEPDWHLCVGKLEGRKRHRGPGLPPPPSDKEMKALETAHAMEPTSITAVHLAAALVDRARAEGSSNSNDYDRAFSLYNEALEANKEEEEEDSHVVIRCATGLNKLPPRFNGTEVAKELFEKALKMAPKNAMLNHHLGLLYVRMGQLDKSVKYLKTSEEVGCLPAGLKLLEVLVVIEPEGEGSTASVEEQYKRLEEKYLEDKLQGSLHFHAASFHLTITQDIDRLVYHITKGLHSNIDLSRFRRFPCKWNPTRNRGPLDVLGETAKTLKEALRLRDTGGVERDEVEALLRRIQERSGGRGTGGGGERGQYGTVRIEGRRGGRGGRGGGGWRPRDPHHPPNQSSSTWRDKKKEPSSNNWRSEPRNRPCAEDGDEVSRLADSLGKLNTGRTERGGTKWKSLDSSD